MTTAFVLSGGGARGAAQVGLLRALSEQGIRPDLVVGSSAGAVNGSWFALHPDRLDDLWDVWRGLTKRGVFPGTVAGSVYQFVRYGHVHRIDSWREILEAHYGRERFEHAEIPLVAVTVRLADGRAVAHSSGPIAPVLCASTAVPGLFPPQLLNGERHVDGAVVEFLPVPTAIRFGARRIYALDLSDFQTGVGVTSGVLDRTGQIASTTWAASVIETARQRGVMVTRLRPPLGDIFDGRDFGHTERLIEAGYLYGRQVLAGDVRERFVVGG